MPEVLHTTFRRLREAGASCGAYRDFGKAMGGITAYGQDKPIPFSAGFDAGCATEDIIWALWAATEQDEAKRIARSFALDCASRALPIFEANQPDDARPRDCLVVVKLYLADKASVDELAAARAAARAAAGAAAWDAAGAADGAAAWAAAWAAARAAARAADGAADGAAAWDAAWDAAGAAARDWQRERLLAYLTDPDLRPLRLPPKPRTASHKMAA